MKNIFKKNQMIITALAIMIAVAGYLNYYGSRLDSAKVTTDADASAEEDAEAAADISAEDIYAETGLEAGADDYITKPFSLAVLRARVNAQLRRAVPAADGRVELGGFCFDFSRLEFFREGVSIELSKTEQRLLRLLMENRGRTLPRELLLERVWDSGEFVDENALSVAVRRLRAKLLDAPIKTVYGVGYTWEVKK